MIEPLPDMTGQVWIAEWTTVWTEIFLVLGYRNDWSDELCLLNLENGVISHLEWYSITGNEWWRRIA